MPKSDKKFPDTAVVRANRLAWLGLVPFIVTTLVGAIGIWQEILLHGFMVYSAVILSFLGGIHWGVAMQGGYAKPERNLVLCMWPSVFGWIAVAFLPVLWALAGLGFAFLAWLNYDLRQIRTTWYEDLRRPITFVVTGLHLIWFIVIASEMRVPVG